jgi:hypothetical protein
MDSGDQIEVTNGTSKKTIKVERVADGRATVYWHLAGQYDIDLVSGELMSQVVPINGIYSVDCQTGRVEGTRCRLLHDDLLRLEELRPGVALELEHDASRAGRCRRHAAVGRCAQDLRAHAQRTPTPSVSRTAPAGASHRPRSRSSAPARASHKRRDILTRPGE